MKALALVPALALAAFAFLAPPSAQADDHHGQRHYYSHGYRHYAPSYGYHGYGAAPYYRRNLYYRNGYYGGYYAPGYYGGYYATPYSYAPGYYGGYYGAGYGYYPPPPPVRYCPPRPRAHIGLYFGF